MYLKARSLPNIIVLLSLVVSLIALLASYSVQYIWKIEPCSLCKLQRIPYFFILMFSGIAFASKFSKVAISFIQFGFLVGLSLAIYHLLVISGFLADPCSVPKGVATIEDFQRLLDAPLPCSKTTWNILGIPLAVYNAICSTIFIISIQRKVFY